MKKGKKIWNKVLSLMLCLVIASGMFAGMGMEAKAYEYSGSSESKSIKVMNYAGEYISGGKMNFEGYFYYNGHTEIINGNTINHAIYRTVQTNLNGNEYNVAIWFSYWNSTGSTQVYPSYKYWFEDFNSEYVMPDSGTFDARGTLEIKALRKNVLLNVSLLDANGNPVTSGVTVTMNGQSDSQAPYEFSGLKEGDNYDIKVSGNGYDANMRYTVEKNGAKSRNTSMGIGSRNFLLRAEISLDGNIHDKWWDDRYTIKAGDIMLDHDYNSDGYYFRKKLPAGTYELSVEGLKGVTVASQNIDLNSKDQTITLQATLKTPEITGGNVVKCGETLDLNIKEVVEYWEPTYIWRSSDPSVATIDENGIITGKKVGTTKVTATCSYGNQRVTSAEKIITVIKGQTNHPTGAVFVDTDVVNEKKIVLKVSNNANVLNMGDMAIVKVSGDCIVGGSYTTETPIAISEDRTVTVDLSGKLIGEYLQGIVGAELTYNSENYDYEPTGVTDNAGTSTYYITMPLSVALNTNGTSIEQERLVYGDTRTLSIHTTDNIIAGNKIKYLFNVTEAPDVLSGIDSSNLSDKTTALDDIVVANAGTTKVLVTRPRIGAPYYWEAASDEIFVEVAKKEINPLTMVIYKNATERVYDGTNVIETIGTIVTDSADGKVKDSDDVSVSAQLFIEGKDVGTYTPANGNIKITNYALTGADARNYKLPDSIPTEKIKTIDTSLTIKERPVTVSGIKASDKLYDQNANAELNYNEVTISNIVDGEDLNVTATGLFLGKDVVRDSLSSAIAKTVEISEIKLMDGTLGKVSNYVLGPSGNQKTTTATIHPIKTKVLVTVNDKQYDGLNTATIKNSGLEGIIAGDTVILENGTPTFDSVGEADNEKTIGVSFTDFSIRGADAINYDLTQPTGVKANIYNNYKAEKKIDYDVNSNEWINKDFVVTANINYQLSETDDMTSGTWSATLSRSEDVTDGKLKFYIRDMESGAISKSVIETYNIDTILPTGEVELAENKWMVFWNGITFEKFFNKTQTVTITAYDERSGVASVEYYEADRELNLDELKALSTEAWTEGKKVNVTLEDAKKFVYYARITDKAGNVNYLNTNGSVYDITFPTLTGVEESEVYYTTQTITVKDINLATIKLNGEDVTSPVRLSGNVDKVYEVVAIDKAGNKATLSITMKPLSELSGDITDNNVTLSDEKELEKSKEILEIALKEENLSKLSRGEEEAIREKLIVIQNLLQDIDEVKQVIKLLKNLPSAYVKDGAAVNPYVSDRMDDEEQKLYSAVKAAYKAYDKLSSHQQSLISTSLKHNLSDLRKILTDYRIIDGSDKVWVYDTNGTLTFTANGPVVRFTAAFVDGKKVPADEMKVTKGSTVVELDAGYLYSLCLGDHTFQMEYEDGKTDVVEFSIVTMEEWNAMLNQQSGSNKTGGVATGDSANILLWGAALILGATGLVVANKKRKNEEL